MSGESTQLLLFLAIVGLTVVQSILPCSPSNKSKTAIRNIDEFDRCNKIEWMR